VAFAIFLLVKAVNRLKREEKAPAAAPTTKACPQCLMEVPVAARKCGHCTSQLSAA
jgi:large conductance mechanosensitive channel